VAAPGALGSIVDVPEFREHAGNRNAQAAIRSGKDKVIRFFICDSSLELLIL